MTRIYHYWKKQNIKEYKWYDKEPIKYTYVCMCVYVCMYVCVCYFLKRLEGTSDFSQAWFTFPPKTAEQLKKIYKTTFFRHWPSSYTEQWFLRKRKQTIASAYCLDRIFRPEHRKRELMWSPVICLSWGDRAGCPDKPRQVWYAEHSTGEERDT